jgi:flavin-dependent dehydrogenase
VEPNRDRYSFVVVGAGPAGVMAARAMAARGPVLLVDASALPRDKSCGGMLNHHARSFLSRIAPVPAEMVLEPEHVNFRYVDWDRDLSKPTELEFANVDRRRFDDWLLSLLPSSVEVVGGCRMRALEQSDAGVLVTLQDGGDPLQVTTDWLVGADGARSSVRRQLSPERPATYVTLQDRVRLEGSLPPYFDCIYMRDVGDCFAYAYVVPKGPEAIVGSVFYPHTRHPAAQHEQVLVELRTRLPQLGEALRREAGAALSVRSRRDVLQGQGRVLLAGEAAGFMSPSSGEGISYALNTGSLAGQALARGGDALHEYTRATAAVCANIRHKLRWLPFMESRVGKYLAGFVPTAMVSRATLRL